MRLQFTMADSMVIKYVGETAAAAEMRNADTISWSFSEKTKSRTGFAL